MKRVFLMADVVLVALFFFCRLDLAVAFSSKHPAKINSIKVPFDMPEVTLPVIPEREFDIKDFGALGDGKTDNTQAIAQAIRTCADQGGGRVIIPRGIWLTGPIQLVNDMELHAEDGALVLFSTRFEDYPLLEATTKGLSRPYRCMSPIYGANLENIAITGKGIFDGNGQAWRPVKKYKMTPRQWQDLVASDGAVEPSGEIWWPSEQAMRGEALINTLMESPEPVTEEQYAQAREYLRPNMVSLVECKNVLLDGPTFQNSPSWNIHPLMCEHVTVRNITVRNPWFSQNGDGLDLESCRNVLVYDSNFDVGDDAICLKSGKDKEGRDRGRPSEKMIITHCIVYHGHGGFTIGSEMSGDVRDIFVSNCTFIGTDVGLRFKSTRGRGGVVDNIYCENIDMIDIPTDAIRFNMYYNNNAPEDAKEGSSLAPAVPVTKETPRFQNIYLKNITCRGADRAVILQGLPEMPIRNISLQDVFISADRGLYCVDAMGIQIKNVEILSSGPVVSIVNGREIQIDSISGPETCDVFFDISGKSRQIELANISYKNAQQKFKLSQDVSESAIIQH